MGRGQRVYEVQTEMEEATRAVFIQGIEPVGDRVGWRCRRMYWVILLAGSLPRGSREGEAGLDWLGSWWLSRRDLRESRELFERA